MNSSSCISALLVSRNTSVFEEIHSAIQEAGFLVTRINSLSDTIKALKQHIPDCILLDAQLGEISCFELCHNARSLSPLKQTKIFILSERKDTAVEIMAFDSGADDFIQIPLDVKVLIKRIQIRTRHDSNVISVQSKFNRGSKLRIDRESFTVFLNQNHVPLSRLEFELLHLLASQPGKVFTREEILKNVWKRNPVNKDRTIDVHILRLRKKIGDAFIFTQKGIGYRFSF